MKGDFEHNVRTGEYLTKLSYVDNREAFRKDQNRLIGEFHEDAKAYAIRCGVPGMYAGKVISLAWDQGHSYGFSESLNHLDTLIQIFK